MTSLLSQLLNTSFVLLPFLSPAHRVFVLPAIPVRNILHAAEAPQRIFGWDCVHCVPFVDVWGGVCWSQRGITRRNRFRVFGKHTSSRHRGVHQLLLPGSWPIHARRRGESWCSPDSAPCHVLTPTVVWQFRLWFDPSAAFHDYMIQWSRHQVIFWVDHVPIRIIQRQGKDCSEFPCQPMGIQGSVWDASVWATEGGRIKANYEFAPFQLTVRDLNIWRSMVCHVHLPERKCLRKKGVWNHRLTRYQHLKMAHYRHKLLIYSNVVGCGNLNRPPCSQVAT